MKKYLLLIPSLVLVFLIAILLINKAPNTKIDFNTNVELVKNENQLTNTLIATKTNDLDLIKFKTSFLSSSAEKEVIETAKNMAKAINNYSMRTGFSETRKYFIRPPSQSIDDDLFSEAYKEYLNYVTPFESYVMVFYNHEAKFKDIIDSKVIFQSSKRYVVEVYVSDLSYSFTNRTITVDAIYTFDLIFEESSSKYKVNNFSVQFVKDIKSFFQTTDKEERQQNKNDSSSFSNISKYKASGLAAGSYDKLDKVSDKKVKEIFKSNKNSVAIIDSTTENGLSTGNAYGFFVRKGIMVTTYESIYKMIDNGAKHYYAIFEDEQQYEIDGIVSIYPEINIAIIKLKEEVGEPVKLRDTSNLQKDDPVMIISSSLGLKSSTKLGVFHDIFKDDYNIVRTSVPLTDGDSGSPIFNLNGEVIAVNNSVQDSSENFISGINKSIDIDVIKKVIEVIGKKEFSNIKSTNFNNMSNTKQAAVRINVSKSVMDEYYKLPVITNYIPLTLSSAYTNKNYLILRYKNDTSVMDFKTILNIYTKNLQNSSYEKVSENVYKKNDITIRLNNNLGYLVVIVEGVV